jgi:hypothetical protein
MTNSGNFDTNFNQYNFNPEQGYPTMQNNPSNANFSMYADNSNMGMMGSGNTHPNSPHGGMPHGMPNNMPIVQQPVPSSNSSHQKRIAKSCIFIQIFLFRAVVNMYVNSEQPAYFVRLYIIGNGDFMLDL